jgi:hypothetical protein
MVAGENISPYIFPVNYHDSLTAFLAALPKVSDPHGCHVSVFRH